MGVIGHSSQDAKGEGCSAGDVSLILGRSLAECNRRTASRITSRLDNHRLFLEPQSFNPNPAANQGGDLPVNGRAGGSPFVRRHCHN
jgi:hypothetical protein